MDFSKININNKKAEDADKITNKQPALPDDNQKSQEASNNSSSANAPRLNFTNRKLASVEPVEKHAETRPTNAQDDSAINRSKPRFRIPVAPAVEEVSTNVDTSSEDIVATKAAHDAHQDLAATSSKQSSGNDANFRLNFQKVDEDISKANTSNIVKNDEASTSYVENKVVQNGLNFKKSIEKTVEQSYVAPLVVATDNEMVEESYSTVVDVDELDDFNPLLDDDEDEYYINVSDTVSASGSRSKLFDESSSISNSSSSGVSSDFDDEDAAPFTGFASNKVVASTSYNENESVNLVEAAGFDDLLSDLLGDDDELVLAETDKSFEISESERVADQEKDRLKAIAKANREKQEAAKLVANEARNVVRGNSLNEVKHSDEDQKAIAKRKARIESWKEERASKPKVSKVQDKKTKLQSDFGPQAPVEVTVGADGRMKSSVFTSDSTNAKKASSDVTGNVANVGVTEKQRFKYMRPDGKINAAELSFFKNAQSSKTSAKANPSEMEMLRGPVNRNETEAERKERSKRIVRAAEGRAAFKRGNQLRFGQKERETLEFLALFRYATDQQLSRMFSEKYTTTYNRLKKLRQQGFVIDKKLYGTRPIWFLTEAGLVISGYDLPRVTESKLTFSMFPHQFTVNNTAANLWGANLNVLNQPDYPSKNRTNTKGDLVFGENLTSELEIQSSFGKAKMFDKSDVYRPQLLGAIDLAFKQWERAGGVEFGPSPEMLYGNEYMWSLMPPYNIRLAYHVPDLVVKRDRAADGSPRSIAVEIEISNKASESYEKTLLAYKSDKRLYEKVIWVCKSAGPAGKLESIAKKIGLLQEGRIDIVPVLTEAGVFKERDLWTI